MRIDAIKPTEVVRAADPSAIKPADASEADFGKLLSEALDKVNHLQKDAEKASIDLAAGKIQDISQVTIASEKAAVALQLTMQVRNKVIDAYQEIMRMQV
jgi:flagellar hook-basal body complex protein FliE